MKDLLEQAFDEADRIVKELTNGRCWVQKCTVREHEHNSATVELADPKSTFYRRRTITNSILETRTSQSQYIIR